MSGELRSKWWSRPLGHLMGALIKAICCTLRKKVIYACDPNLPKEHQIIAALWHNRTFTPCHFYRYVVKGATTMSMLTSASKDGAMLATIAEDYGMRAVRGSSGRRGVAGFMDVLRELKSGYSMCITPDGPKGPRYKCRPGVVKAASASGVPIVPICIEIPSCWRVNSAWDGYIIPKPFSCVTLHLGEPIQVPADADEETVRTYCRRLEEALSYSLPDFPPLSAYPADASQEEQIQAR